MRGIGVIFDISGHWSAVHGPELIDHYLELLKLNEERGATN